MEEDVVDGAADNIDDDLDGGLEVSGGSYS